MNKRKIAELVLVALLVLAIDLLGVYLGVPLFWRFVACVLVGASVGVLAPETNE